MVMTIRPVHGSVAVQTSFFQDDEFHVFCGECRRWLDVGQRRSASQALEAHALTACSADVVGV